MRTLEAVMVGRLGAAPLGALSIGVSLSLSLSLSVCVPSLPPPLLSLSLSLSLTHSLTLSHRWICCLGLLPSLQLLLLRYNPNGS